MGNLRFAVLTLLLGVAAPSYAQQQPARFETGQDSTRVVTRAWTTMRVAKWSVLLAATGSAAYGFAENRSADRAYEAIERLCQDTPEACTRRLDNNAYEDAALEARYQDVVKRDERARFALLAGQVGIAASVLLFILDLPGHPAAEDIPYHPRPLRLGLDRSGAIQVGLKLDVR